MAISLGEFAKLLNDAARANEAEGEGVLKACKLVQKTAKCYIGSYDHPGSWAQLAQATQEDRVRRGFAANEPLLRTGELRDSIEVDAPHKSGMETYGFIFSSSEVARYMELGTTRAPPRPFLSTATMECMPKIRTILGASFVKARFGAWGAFLDLPDGGE
ncbi:hypothetical protein [Methylocystis sp.]|uniref:hypothetical protein n=1 Tax=Methylocystis sp. TaxID=1911079 RepID=UPI003DA3A79E